MENDPWKNRFKELLIKKGVNFTEIKHPTYSLCRLGDGQITVHLINISNKFLPAQVVELSDRYSRDGGKFVQLWEDVWLRNQEIVVDRLQSFCRLNVSLHGRKTRFQSISKPVAQKFLEENHLQGYVSSRFKYGLFLLDDLVAVATFSAVRKMNYAEEYTSIELIRFAVKRGHSVVGGLSKLLRGHVRLHPTDDVMTYIDKDWGRGLAFEKLGFLQTDVTSPQFFTICDDFNRIKDMSNVSANRIVFNSGSIKMVLRF